ncbi:tetratricopeptide repeat protein [Reinekea sp.]|jgi:tetratricopeptide (TPR) repeat protein|uniref:tetratricopeptide repeat protein n=1 Tax=Reinekea sp. TaxID=1970455 RepID=UPI002A80E7AD|nr:tetratricopeptide repeat protein [Reinekea sp.]
MRLITSALVFFMSNGTLAADVLVVPLSSDAGAQVSSSEGGAQQPIETLVTLVNARQWSLARLMADELSDRFEGLPRFDLYLGLLEMAEGDFDRAIFSFERVLVFAPGQYRARLELGRAYYLSANYQRARDELKQVLASAPPADVRQNIDRLLARIEAAARQADTKLSFGGTVLGGWDGNANGGGNADGQLDANLTGQSALDTPSLALASPYVQWTLNASRFTPISRSASNRVSVDLSGKDFIAPELADASALTLANRLFNQDERWRSQFPVSVQWSWLEGQLWQTSLDLNLSHQYRLWGPLWAGVKFGTEVTVTSATGNSSGANDLAGFLFDAQERGRVHTFSTVYLQTMLAGQDDGHLEWQGLANRYQLGWQGPWQMQGSLAVEHQWRHYRADDLFFTLNSVSTELKRRQDQVINLDIQATWSPTDWLQTRTALSWQWVNSNINAYGSDRLTISQAMSVQF